MIELVQERMRTSEIARIAKAEKAAAELDLEQLRVELVQAINAAPAAMLERERFRAEAEVAAEATNDELFEQSMRTTELRFQARSSAGTPPDEHGSANDTEASVLHQHYETEAAAASLKVEMEYERLRAKEAEAAAEAAMIELAQERMR